MQTVWQLQDAENHFSQVIKQAVAGEAQMVTVHGRPAAVVLSAEEYQRLTRPSTEKLSAALLDPELAADDLDFSRSRETGREIEL
jgi:prevent-host-death family protein